jgi:1-deoxy-D-xylulose-5-phosphate reductoisomerase
MGKKISVDSATMMNKGLEVIEAHYLFKLGAQQIDVVIHPQSIVHSSVYFKDGSVISQLGIPDMRTAIAFAISYPERIASGVQDLNLADASPLEFYEPDYEKFRCLKLSFDALRSGGSAMGTLNAANEVAVSSFLGGQIKFLDIPRVIEETLSGIQNTNLESLDAVIENDLRSRKFAEEAIKRGF